jgi:predicted metal-dependent phosphoesterase TrpH
MKEPEVMRFDIHVHTDISPCSNLRIEDILTNAKTKGLDGLCITDHDTMDVRYFVKEGIQEDGLCVIFGMEYTTTDGDFLIFGPFEDLELGLSVEKLLNLVHEKGGIAVAAHPCRKGNPVSKHVIDEGLCTIAEGRNGRNSDREDACAEEWIEKYALQRCAGSDAHSLDELGGVVTYIETPVRSREDFIVALRNDGLTTTPH